MRDRNFWGLVGVVLLVLLVLIVGVGHGTPTAPAPSTRAAVHPDLTQLHGYQLRQIALPNFAYLYPYVYNYRLQYPVVSFAGPCSGGILYITNSSVLDCYTVSNATAWAISPALTLLYQRTVGIQGQIDNEFQLDAPYDVALLYGNRTTSAGPVTVEAVNLTTGVLKIADTPVPMDNSIQCDYVGAWLVACANGTGAHGSPELTNLSNGTSWRSGLGVGVATNNYYWVPQIGAFIDVAGPHFAEFKFNPARTTLTNVGNAWTNRTGVTSVTAVNGIAYDAASGLITTQLATNLGSMISVIKLTGGKLTPAGAYSYLTSTNLYISRYCYTTGYLWSLTGTTTSLFNPLTNQSRSAPNVVGRQNSSGADNNYEFTNPYSTNVYLSLNTTLTGNASRAPNQFVWASYPVAVHSRAFVVTNSGTKVGAYSQLVAVNSAQDSAWEAANLSNVFWTYSSNGSSIPAWLEANASSAATHTIWWLALAPLLHSATVTVLENFAGTTQLTFGRTAQTGEAPTLTGTYGAFDNGAVVFPLYDNFAGTTLDSAIWAASGSVLVVSNGVTTVTAPTPSAGGFCGLIGKVQNVSKGTNYSVDAYGAAGAFGARWGPGVSNTGTSSACSTSNAVVSNLDFSATAYQPSNLVGVFSQSPAGTISTNTCGLTWKTTANYLMSLGTIGTTFGVAVNESATIGACGVPPSGFANYSVPAMYPSVWLKSSSAGTATGALLWVRERVLPATMPVVAGVPLAPTALAVAGTAPGTLHATWTNPPGTVTNDTLFRWAGAICVGSVLTNSTSGSATTWTIAALATNATFSFEVAASNATGTGPGSSCVTARTFAVPLPPTLLTAGTPDTSSVPLSWQLPAGTVLNVTVNVGSTCAAPWAEQINLGAVSTYAVAGLKSTTRYSFTVAASNSTGTSSLSACVSATTATPGPSPGPTPGPNPPAPPHGLIPAVPSNLLTLAVVVALVLVAVYAVGWAISPSRPDR